MKTPHDILNELDKSLADVVSEYTDDFSPIELARYFVKVRQIKDEAEATTKQFDAFYEELAKIKIPTIFDQHKVPSISLDEGYRVTVSHALRASIRSGAREAAHQWLRDHGLADIVTETVNASTLSAVAKTMAEENQDLDPDLFNTAIIANTSFNRLKGK